MVNAKVSATDMMQERQQKKTGDFRPSGRSTSVAGAAGRPPAKAPAGESPVKRRASSRPASGGKTAVVGSKATGGGKAAAAAAPPTPKSSAASRSTSSPAGAAGRSSSRRPPSPVLTQAGGLIATAGSAEQDGAARRGVGAATQGESREAIQERLLSKGNLQHDDANFMHGRAYVGPMRRAEVTWKSDKKPRADHHAPDWLTATEFEDLAEVLDAKCEQLANLLRLSRKTVLYTGAGISASVIGQAALSGQNKVGWKANKMEAEPTPTHCALGLLGREGIIHGWIQQNHDGLPQKAGFPQESINEIHGSWYDPCNPVVKYSGSLHERAYPWMEQDAATADLVLVLGTSLGGLNADQVAHNAAERSLKPGARGALGTVCINLQQTEQDGTMSLRLFGKSDDILAVVLRKLGLPMPRKSVLRLPKESRVLVPYDAQGRRLPEGSTEKRMWLDLRDGQQIRITEGHNIQGAKQPQFMHIGTARQPGNGVVQHRDPASCSFGVKIEGANMRLGMWWLDTAERGAVEMLPIVNTSPAFERCAGRSAAPQPKTRSANA